jgi:surfactin synthase thioesterase subunit
MAVRRPHLEAWREATSAEFHLHMFTGDPLYLTGNEAS